MQAGAASDASQALYGAMESFSLHSQFLRFNFDWNADKELRFRISEVVFRGDYEEVVSGNKFRLTYDQLVTSFRVQQEFGDFVSLKGILNYFIREYHSKSTQHDKKTGEKKVSFAVAVEFVL